MEEIFGCFGNFWNMPVNERVTVRQASEGSKVEGIVEILVDAALRHGVAGQANGNEKQGKHCDLRNNTAIARPSQCRSSGRAL